MNDSYRTIGNFFWEGGGAVYVFCEISLKFKGRLKKIKCFHDSNKICQTLGGAIVCSAML
jgi:hypothetical protein